MRQVPRIVAGVVCGYAIMVVLIILVREVWLGGVAWGKSPLGILAIAGFFTCVAAALGAISATAISRISGRTAVVVMCCLVVLEMTVLTVTDKLTGSLWFELSAAGSLIVAMVLGAELLLRFTGKACRQPTAA